VVSEWVVWVVCVDGDGEWVMGRGELSLGGAGKVS